MSKYNLIDIYEQYQIGSGWTRDFDYDGMLKTGLKTGVDTDIKLLKALAEDYTDVNYHREASHLYNAIEALEEGAIKEASMFFGDFHAEIKATMGDQSMDIEPTLGKFMDTKMEENTEAVDLAIETSQEKAGINEDEDKDKEPRDGVKSAAAKLGIKPKHVKEVSSQVGSRIEGLLNIPMKQKFLDAGMDLIQDLLEEDPFFIPDVIDHLSIELEKYYDGFLDQGDKLAGMDQQEFTAIDEEDSIEEALPKFKGVPPMKDIVKALKDDAKATDSEIKQFMASIKKAGDEYDDVDDYVEDFKNYVDDKALQEHFGRFMKDYQ
jgi:gas vesicle protein